MRDNLATRVLGVIISTFVVAIVYGLFLTTMDFYHPNYSPVASGHRAAANIYGLFGTVSDEVKHNDAGEPAQVTSIARKIAMPYAIVADLSAIFGGKLEMGFASLVHNARNHLDKSI